MLTVGIQLLVGRKPNGDRRLLMKFKYNRYYLQVKQFFYLICGGEIMQIYLPLAAADDDVLTI